MTTHYDSNDYTLLLLSSILFRSFIWSKNVLIL